MVSDLVPKLTVDDREIIHYGDTIVLHPDDEVHLAMARAVRESIELQDLKAVIGRSHLNRAWCTLCGNRCLERWSRSLCCDVETVETTEELL